MGMRITEVWSGMVCAPFRERIEWGSGTRTGTTRLLVRIGTDSGVTGWGEAQCLIPSTPAVMDDVARIAIGYDVSDVERLHRHVLGAGYYHHQRAAVFAIAALEMAMWDAFGKICGQPLWRLWGGRWRNRVEASAYLFHADPARLGPAIAAFLDDGFGTFKVKIGFDAASDIRLAEAARRAIGDRTLRLDVNGAWTPGTARAQLTRLAPLAPAYVEQPLELSDLTGHAHLRRSQPVPIALDESVYTLTDAGRIVTAEAADVLLLDPHQAGGLWQTLKAAGIAEAAGLPVTLHSGGELALSQAAYLHLAASIPNMTIAIDTERTYLGADISQASPRFDGGAFDVPEAPGLGVEVDEDLVHALSVDRIEGAYLDPARPGWFPVKPAY
jgi:glucarate dehydratase